MRARLRMIASALGKLPSVANAGRLLLAHLTHRRSVAMAASPLTILGTVAIALLSAHPQEQEAGVREVFDVASVRENPDRTVRTMIDIRGLRGGTLT